MRALKFGASLLVGSTLCTIAGLAQTYNYVEALQKSLYFYDAEKSGPGISGGRLEWRGDSEVGDRRLLLSPTTTNLSQAFITANRAALDPDGDGFVDVSGGFHDAGDHVKFGLPQSYASSTLEWGYYEFREAFTSTGRAAHMEEILRWFADYYLRCTFRNASGQVIAFCYQVGEGTVDHNYWGPPELQDPLKYPRPGYFATAENPASDQAAGAAASLAITYLNFKNTDALYAARCLDTAKALYAFAVQHRGSGYSGGFYNSSYDEDELSWAAIWLHIATSQQSYLTDIISTTPSGQYTGWLKKIIATTENNWQNIWVHSWDTKWGGVFAKLAPVTNDPFHWYVFRWNLEYWSHIPHQDPADTNYLSRSPAGFSVLNTWGSARYNTAAQMQALVYRKYTGRADFSEWARGQMQYIMGNNPLGRSYIVGYGASHAEHPHHRAAHGSSTNSTDNPVTHRHTLWGALVGGPDSADNHKDETSDYVYNEVAIDYNATLVGALAGHVTYFGAGQSPLLNFPPAEPPALEFFAKAKIEQENTERSQITISINNASVHPPSYNHTYKARYFFNISELLAAGQTIADVSMEIYYDQQGVTGPATLRRGPLPWDAANGIYYVEFEWQNSKVYGSIDLQFALLARQSAAWTSHWNPANDFSHDGLVKTEKRLAPKIALFVDGVLMHGEQPGITVIHPSSVTLSPVSASLLAGATRMLAATVSPANATDPSVIWVSSAPAVATVNANGLVTAIAPGVATITVATLDGNKTASATITVTTGPIAVQSVSVDPLAATLSSGTTRQLSAMVTPANATNPAITWASSAPAVATVNASGLVTALSAGTAVITATSVDGSKTSSSTITVTNATPPCTFGAPMPAPLASINRAYAYVHVLGQGGPDLSNVRGASINWDLGSAGLYQFSFDTRNGQPDWFVDLLGKTTRQLNQAQPQLTIAGSGIARLDGSYWVASDGPNLALVPKNGGFTIYFSNSATAPVCGN